MKTLEMVRLLIGDELPESGDDSQAVFTDTAIDALLARYGDNPERVAAVCMQIIANDHAKLFRRAQTLNLTVDYVADAATRASDKLFDLADKTEAGEYSQSRPMVTKQSTSGRPIFDKKGIEGVGDGVRKDSDATGVRHHVMDSD